MSINKMANITWEQAVNLNQITPTAEKYHSELKNLLLYFGKNTHAQLIAGDILMRAYDLDAAYRDKDYSRFLFAETQSLLDQFEENRPKLDELRASFLKLAQVTSAELNKNK